MSRLPKWKLEKTKVKVVFRLQFHATHIPPTGWDKLFISFIPADSGKATAKTTKANVRNGACKWGDPIYETTRLLQDVKTKQYDEKMYKLVVAMGSSRSSILGEASINLADYSDASKPSAVALPLQGCDSGTVLHVTVQLLTSKTGFREFEQQRELTERGSQTARNQNNQNDSGSGKVSSSEETINDQMDKVNARARFRSESRRLSSHEDEVGVNEEYADSAGGYDGSSNTSESLYAEKQDLSSIHEIDSIKSTISGDLGGQSLSQSPRPEKGGSSNNRFPVRGSNDWVHGWSPDHSLDNDLAIVYEENAKLRGSLEVAESSIVDLKLEVSSLQIHANELGIESQKFSQQLAGEITSGEELTKEVSVLRSDCSQLKENLERLKDVKLSHVCLSRETIETNQDKLVQDLLIRWQKGLGIVEEKVRELQGKTCLGFHEKDINFLNPGLEALLGAVLDLKRRTGQDISVNMSEQLGLTSGFDVDLYQPEDFIHSLSIPGLISHEPDSLDATNGMKDKIFELLRELDESKAERENLARKMDQMECYYEALIQELEENQKLMLGELQNLRNEHSVCLYTISATNAQMETMRQDMNDQITRYVEDKQQLDSLNKELERRAITSEASLKRARLNYSIAVDKLQKDLQLLSFQVVSMYETNENLIRQAFPQPSQPCFHGDPETDQNQKPDSEVSDAFKLRQTRIGGVKRQQLGRDMILEELRMSLHLQEELYQKVEEELCEMQLVNINLDVFAKALKETLFDASGNNRRMKNTVDELTQQLKSAIESKEFVLRRLESTMEDVRALNEYKESWIAKCNEMAVKNQILEAKLVSGDSENGLLTQKITELEALMMEFRIFKDKYEACDAEKVDLENLLMQQVLENGDLVNEISSLQEKLKSAVSECCELVSLKENLQNTVNFLQDKLGFLVATYDKEFSGESFQSRTLDRDLDFNDFPAVVSQLEELQHDACGKILKLTEENKDLKEERDVARVSLSTAESEILALKQKFESDLLGMVSKQDMSIVLVEKLQLDLQAATGRINLSTETEEKYTQLNKEVALNFSRLEVELQEVTSKNKDLAHEILALETVTGELERRNLTVSDLMHKNKLLITSLQETTDESVKLELELSISYEICRCLNHELHTEVGFKDKLESTVSELASQLKEKNEQLLCFHQQKAELEELQHNACGKVLQLMEEKKVLEEERDMAQVSLSNAKSEILAVKQKFECDVLGLVNKLEMSNVLVQKLQLDLQAATERIKLSTESEEKYAQLNKEVALKFSRLEVELQESTSKNKDLAHEILALESLTGELERRNLTVSELTQKEKLLITSLQETTDKSVKLESELSIVNESLRCLNDELHMERGFRCKLESTVSEFASQLKEKNEQLLCFDQQKAELVQFKKQASDLELEKSKLGFLLLQHEERLSKSQEEYSSAADLESELYDMHKFCIDVDVKFIFLKSKYEGHLDELVMQLKSSETLLGEFHKRHLDIDTRLNQCLASEALYKEENAKLMTDLESLRSELEASVTQNCVLKSNSTITSELEQYKDRAATAEDNFLKAKNQHYLEVQHLKHILTSFGNEIDNLIFSKEELEIEVLILEAKLNEMRTQANLLEGCGNDLVKLQSQCSELTRRLSGEASKEEEFDSLIFYNEELEIEVLVLKGKLNELRSQIILLKGCQNDVMKLQNQCTELTQRLSEEVLRAEEFKNLSIHFKELRDKAEAESIQTREKKESEGHKQDSLRIAFIKEQYETKVQELKQQLSISKKHGEEILCKLQDTIDEVESRKKSEASHLKKNDELSEKILQLEADLGTVITEKREKVSANDRLQAELECSLISLECCKEEKQKLEESLQQCCQEKAKIEFELISKREWLEKSIIPSNIPRENSNESYKIECISEDHVVRRDHRDNPAAGTTSRRITSPGMAFENGKTDHQYPRKLDIDGLINCEAENVSIPIDECGQSSVPVNTQPMQDTLASRGAPGSPSHELAGQKDLLHAGMEELVPINEQFKSQNLKLAMDHLHNELEKMKRENSLLQDDNGFEPNSLDIHRELFQLNKANEELRSIYPLYNEFSGSGKALERVLALELELAEALQAKKKSSFHFQSSFLKQHSDEEAIFKSFRDINELIKDMLELKGKYTSVETELKDMHDRYSQLSLQFAEVEGERQKLMMTLKNVRTSKKVQLNRSSSVSLGE